MKMKANREINLKRSFYLAFFNVCTSHQTLRHTFRPEK